MSPWLFESVDLSLCLLFGSVSTTLGLRLCLCDCDCICLCLCLYVWIGCGSISCSSSVSVSPRQRSSTLPAYPFVCFLLIFYILPVPLSFFPCLYPPQTPQNSSLHHLPFIIIDHLSTLPSFALATKQQTSSVTCKQDNTYIINISDHNKIYTLAFSLPPSLASLAACPS